MNPLPLVSLEISLSTLVVLCRALLTNEILTIRVPIHVLSGRVSLINIEPRVLANIGERDSVVTVLRVPNFLSAIIYSESPTAIPIAPLKRRMQNSLRLDCKLKVSSAGLKINRATTFFVKLSWRAERYLVCSRQRKQAHVQENAAPNAASMPITRYC